LKLWAFEELIAPKAIQIDKKQKIMPFLTSIWKPPFLNKLHAGLGIAYSWTIKLYHDYIIFQLVTVTNLDA